MSMGVEIRDQDDGETPLLRPLIGLRVIGAWVIPPGDTLFVRFEGGKILQASAIPSVGALAVACKVGDEKPATEWRFLDTLPQKCKESMAGKRFEGLEGNVAVFVADDGTRFGALIDRAQVTWVKEGPGRSEPRAEPANRVT